MNEQDDFVSMFIEFTKDFESPTSFWYWSALSLIAAILRDNICFEYKTGRIYPNTYTLLLADSASFRKSGPFGLVENLLGDVNNTKVFSGSASIQGVIDRLYQDIPDKKSGFPKKGGSCLILAEELASFFVEDKRLIPLLTRMYDFKKEFPYELRGGSITIKNLCVTMLAASNETHLRDVYDVRANYGGLLRRTLLIKPDKRRKANSLVMDDIINNNGGPPPVIQTNEELRKPLIESLKKISALKGNVKFEKDAAIFYDSWYNDLYSKYDKIGNRAGVLEGMHILALKVAIQIAASHYRLNVTKADFEEAIVQVVSLRPNYDLYIMGTGKQNQASLGAIILSELWKKEDYKLSRKDILLRHWADISAEELDKLITTLHEAGIVRVTSIGMNEIGYELTERGRNILSKKEKEK